MGRGYVVNHYGKQLDLNEAAGICVHSLRATAATNAPENSSDITTIQEWLGHANVSTTRLYDKHHNKPEDSLTFRVRC